MCFSNPSLNLSNCKKINEDEIYIIPFNVADKAYCLHVFCPGIINVSQLRESVDNATKQDVYHDDKQNEHQRHVKHILKCVPII